MATTFDVQGAGTGFNQGTLLFGINPAGAVTGGYIDASGVAHGFVRAKDGTITTFDAPGAGIGHSHRATTAIYFSKTFFPKGAFLTACTFSLQAHSSIRKDCGFVQVGFPSL